MTHCGRIWYITVTCVPVLVCRLNKDATLDHLLLCLCRICCFRRSSTLLPQYHYAPQTWVRHLCIWSRQKHMCTPHQNAIALRNHIITKSYIHAICSQGLDKHEWAEAGSTSKAGSTPTRLLACLFVVLLSTCWHRCCGMSVHSSLWQNLRCHLHPILTCLHGEEGVQPSLFLWRWRTGGLPRAILTYCKKHIFLFEYSDTILL